MRDESRTSRTYFGPPRATMRSLRKAYWRERARSTHRGGRTLTGSASSAQCDGSRRLGVACNCSSTQHGWNQQAARGCEWVTGTKQCSATIGCCD